MKITSIDFSLISPAMTNYDSTTHTYDFISFTAVPSLDSIQNSKKYLTHRQISPYITLIPYIRQINKSTYQTEQSTKLSDAINLSSLILSQINSFSPDYVCLEGFAYCSQGSSAIDLIMYQSILRACINRNHYPLIIVSPTEGKKSLSGKGNADKMTMVQSFIQNKPDIDYIVENSFFQFLRCCSIDEKKLKPIDDIVDSYGILLAGEKLIQ